MFFLQRQRSLVIVNMIDFVIKMVTLTLTLTIYGVATDDYENNPRFKGHLRDIIIWTVTSASCNGLIGALALWPRFANLYLHWGALATWVVLFSQGE